jgi:hypothetical protein
MPPNQTRARVRGSPTVWNIQWMDFSPNLILKLSWLGILWPECLRRLGHGETHNSFRMLPAGKGNSAQQLSIQHQQTLFAALLCLLLAQPRSGHSLCFCISRELFTTLVPSF